MDYLSFLQKEAEIKESLRIPEEFDLSTVSKIGGLDISVNKKDASIAYGTLAVLEYPSLKTLGTVSLAIVPKIPYVAGFLGFREAEIYSLLLEKTKKDRPELYPDVLMVDGNGLWHPRGCGSACHVGYHTGLPSFGVAKNPLTVHEITREAFQKLYPSIPEGGYLKVDHEGEVFGAMVRGGASKNPIFASPGHLISWDATLELTLKTCKHRIPEPIRVADQESRKLAREAKPVTRLLK